MSTSPSSPLGQGSEDLNAWAFLSPDVVTKGGGVVKLVRSKP